MSKPSRRPVSMARWAICTGVWPATIGRLGTSACSASCANCKLRRRPLGIEAGQQHAPAQPLAQPQRQLARRWWSCRSLAGPPSGSGSAPAAFRLSGTAPSPPSASTITSLTILTTCWPGVTEDSTSAPTARSRTLAMKSRTTGSATSASSSARRTSRSASVTSASDSAPRPRRRSNTPESLSDSASNTAHLQRPKRRCANPRGAAEPPHRAGTGSATIPGWRGVMGVPIAQVNAGPGTLYRGRTAQRPNPAIHGAHDQCRPASLVRHQCCL